MSTNYNIFYNGAFNTLLSNYTLNATGVGQVLVTNPLNQNQLIGIIAPNVNVIGKKSYTFVYNKKVNDTTINIENFQWVETDASTISFTNEWQLLTAGKNGNFEYIQPPNFTPGYLVYNADRGITWESTTTPLPFIEGRQSQIIGYEYYTGKTVAIGAALNNYILYSTTATPSGIDWGYLTPLMLGISLNQIQDNLFVKVNQNNTFSLEEAPIYNYDNLFNGSVVYYHIGTNDERYFTGSKSPTVTGQIMYSIFNGSVISYDWSYLTTDQLGIPRITLTENTHFLRTDSSGVITAIDADYLINAPFCNVGFYFNTPYNISSTDIYTLSKAASTNNITEMNVFQNNSIIQVNWTINLCLTDNFDSAIFGYPNGFYIDLTIVIEYTDDTHNDFDIGKQYVQGVNYTFSLNGTYVFITPESSAEINRINIILTPGNINNAVYNFIGSQNYFIRSQYIDIEN